MANTVCTRLALVATAFVFGAAFTSDSAGKACVQQKGERGTAYNTDRTKVSEAYSPSGRRLMQNDQRLYTVEVPALMKRDKPVLCTMALDGSAWRIPGAQDPFAGPAPNPFQTPATPESIPPGRIGAGSR